MATATASIWCSRCGEGLPPDLSECYVYSDRSGVLVRKFGPELHRCEVSLPKATLADRVHRWTLSRTPSRLAPDVAARDFGIGPEPTTLWQTFWFHMAMGSLMHYPIHKVLVWSWRHRHMP